MRKHKNSNEIFFPGFLRQAKKEKTVFEYIKQSGK